MRLKRIRSSWLANIVTGVMILVFAITVSCSNDTPESELSVGKQEKELKVLCVGNSFTEGAFAYVPVLFSEATSDVKLRIAIACIGGSSLAQHYVNLTGDQATLHGQRYFPTRYILETSSSDTPVWHQSWNVDLSELLEQVDWDIVTFQQSGLEASDDYEKYYSYYIREITKIVNRKCGDDTKLGWVMIHGCYNPYESGLSKNWMLTKENAKKVMDDGMFSILFPYGTAIQNLREIPSVKNESDCNGWTVDNGHIQEGLGVLTASYTNTLVLLNEVGITDVTETRFSFLPTEESVKFMNLLSPRFGQNGVVGINGYNCRLAFLSAVQAIENPYSVTIIEDTQSAYSK